MTKGCLCSASTWTGPSKILPATGGTATATGTTGLGSIKSRPRPTVLTLWERDSSSSRARSTEEGRRLSSTGLLVYERIRRGKRDLVRGGVFQVLEWVKAAPRGDDCGEVEAEVVVVEEEEEEEEESVEDWVVSILCVRVKLVVRERWRAVNGEGKQVEIRLVAMDGGEGEAVNCSIVVSSPSKKVTRSGTAFMGVAVGAGGRSMEAGLVLTVCIAVMMSASDWPATA